MDEVELSTTLASLGYDDARFDWVESGAGGPNDVLLVPIQSASADGWFAEWERLRSMVDTTGRWPLLLSDPYMGRSFATIRFEFGREAPSATEMLEIAAQTPPEPIFEQYEPLGWLDDVTPRDAWEHHVRREDHEHLWQGVVDELGPELSPRSVEEWIVTNRLIGAEDWIDQAWMDTGGFDPEFLALVPTADPVAGLAYVSTFYSRPVRSLPIVRRWVDSFGVELVGAISCSYWFKMKWPPADPAEAWRLAIELLELWDCSAGGAKVGIGPADLAPSLMRSSLFDGTTYP